MTDIFTSYETGLTQLLERLGQDHARYAEALVYQQRLQDNIDQARLYGDTPACSAERAQVVDNLNRLALKTVEVSFNEICGRGRHELVLTMPIVRLPLPVLLFFNLVVVIILSLVLRPLVLDLFPCVPVLASAPSLAIILLTLCHLVWRYLNPVFKVSGGTVDVALVAVPIRVIASLADALHPYPQILSDTALWISAVVISLAAGILGLSPLSPFCVQEATPIIQNFLVHRDGLTGTYDAGDVFEIPAYTHALVEAVAAGETDVPCTWSVAQGMQSPAKGCAIVYYPPIEGDRDALSVLVQSPCRSRQTFAGLHVHILQDQP